VAGEKERLTMLTKEPAVVLGALSEVVRAVIPTLIIFGIITWTGEQVAQVMLLTGVLVGFFNVLLTRTQVVPAVVADKQLEIAKASPVNRPTSEIIAQAEKEAV
jgi:hypothetical protein